MNKSLARSALRGALEVRKKAQIPITSPLCIYDVAAEKLGVEVRFLPGARFGGMYAKETQTIMVPSERPVGRRAFTCAHELGHWYFKHGTKVEDLEELEKGGSDDPDEILVNQFAGHLLMPKWAVEKSLSDRRLSATTATEQDYYSIACQFGVGYQTIVAHLRFALEMVPVAKSEQLLRSSPKTIKERLLDKPFSAHLMLVDQAWRQDIAIDLEVGDGALLTFASASEGQGLAATTVPSGTLFIATRPGIFKLLAKDNTWAAFVRISRKGFNGRSIYRHLEDPDAE